MPFDANGNFFLVPGTIVADGMNVLPSQHNPPFQDVANGLSQTMLRSGVTPMSGNLNMNGNRVRNLPDGVADHEPATVGQLNDLGVGIGDGKWSINDLGEGWLRHNGAVYSRAEYPELAALLPVLPDTMNWGTATFTSSAPSGDLVAKGIAQRGATYVAVFASSTGTIIYSSDDLGKTFTPRYTTLSKSALEIHAGENEFLVLARDTSGACSAIRSVDGVSWSSADIPGTSNFQIAQAWQQSVYDGSHYLVRCDDDVHRSEDGLTWQSTARTGILVAASNDVAILISGSDCYQSFDHGANWSVLGSNPFTPYDGVNVGLYAPGVELFIYGTAATNRNIVTAPDGTTLTSRHTLAGASWFSIASSANGVALGTSGGVIAISDDGLSYSNFNIPGSGTAKGVLVDGEVSGRYFAGRGNNLYYGTRVAPTQFRVPDDDPTYGWIRAI